MEPELRVSLNKLNHDLLMSEVLMLNGFSNDLLELFVVVFNLDRPDQQILQELPVPFRLNVGKADRRHVITLIILLVRKYLSHQLMSQIKYPFVYGSVSYPTNSPKRTDKVQQSNWIVYVRGEKHQNMSFLFQKVVFYLHPTFTQPVRTISSHPFEVKEAGWGSFDVIIKIFLVTGDIIELKHSLKLHHLFNQQAQNKRPVVSQYFDQVVFLNPTESAMQVLSRAPERTEQSQSQQKQEDDTAQLTSYLQFTRYLTKFNPKEEAERLKDSIKFIKHEIKKLEEEIQQVDLDIQGMNSSE